MIDSFLRRSVGWVPRTVKLCNNGSSEISKLSTHSNGWR